MSKMLGFATVVALVVAAVVTAGASAVPPGHDHFTSDPYADMWCGIDGTSVDRVVANYTPLDESRTSLNVTTTFTASASGKSMEIHETGVRKEGPRIDNGDGTYSLVFSNAGQSAGFKLPNGPPIGLDVGLIQFHVTFDAATGDFLSFEVLKVAGQRLPLCDAIVAALS
jgi:hypothetical protein